MNRCQRPGGTAFSASSSGLRRAARALAEEVLIGGCQVLAAVAAAPLARRWYARWGARPEEVAAALPGDDLIPSPVLGYTRAITIGTPVEYVWPWVAQMGQGRGGLYSYDALENLVGCDIHSVDRVLPRYQQVQTGDLVRLGREGYPCFRVADVEPQRTLVLIGADVRPPHAAGAVQNGTAGTWQWSLQSRDGGRRTRLVVRQRLLFPPSQRFMWRIVDAVGFVMDRRMLRGIRRRAEQLLAGSPRSPRGGSARGGTVEWVEPVECPAPGLMEALDPREDESYRGTEEVPRRAAGASDPAGGRGSARPGHPAGGAGPGREAAGHQPGDPAELGDAGRDRRRAPARDDH